jgi:predicted glycosyltransferase
MRVWVDLANSPHVAIFEPLVEALHARGDEVVLTVRDHAQTLDLAERAFGRGVVIGSQSPTGRVAKGWAIVERSFRLYRFARAVAPDVALSHGSYSQLIAARAARIGAVTMMDYEHQPANHLSFRLAQRVVVPEVFPEDALERFGAARASVVRYPGFKEELYLGRASSDGAVLREIGLVPDAVIIVFRPPPEGALYHRMDNERFERLLDEATSHAELQTVILPRRPEQAEPYLRRPGVIVPNRPVDGRALLLCADLMIGAGGTMNREAALLGTPTYTMFAGKLAAVDAALIEQGLMFDLRRDGVTPVFEKKRPRDSNRAGERATAIVERVLAAVDDVAGAPARGRNQRR